MEFRIVSKPVVRWPVTVKLPADGGRIDARRFEADIRVFSEQDYAAALPAENRQCTLAERLAENARLLPLHIMEWYGVTDDHGPLPIERLPELIEDSPYGVPLSVALWQAIGEVRFGIPPDNVGATEKNSAPPPAPGATSAA